MKENITVVNYSNFKVEDISESFLNKDMLKDLQL